MDEDIMLKKNITPLKRQNVSSDGYIFEKYMLKPTQNELCSPKSLKEYSWLNEKTPSHHFEGENLLDLSDAAHKRFLVDDSHMIPSKLEYRTYQDHQSENVEEMSATQDRLNLSN